MLFTELPGYGRTASKRAFRGIIKSINYAYTPSGDLELRIINDIQISSEKPLVVKIEPVKKKTES